MPEYFGDVMHLRAGCHVESMQGPVSYSCVDGKRISRQCVCRMPLSRIRGKNDNYGRGDPKTREYPCCRSQSDTSRTNGGFHLDTFDIPSENRKGVFLSAFSGIADEHGRVFASCGEAHVVRRETDTTHDFSMFGPCHEVSHVGLDIADNFRLLVCGPDALVKWFQSWTSTCAGP